ncbi:hypothetical protein D3C74_474600 [compost metagenome]
MHLPLCACRYLLNRDRYVLNSLRSLLRPGSQFFCRSGHIAGHLLHTCNHAAQIGNHRTEIVGKRTDFIPAEAADIL